MEIETESRGDKIKVPLYLIFGSKPTSGPNIVFAYASMIFRQNPCLKASLSWQCMRREQVHREATAHQAAGVLRPDEGAPAGGAAARSQITTC